MKNLELTADILAKVKEAFTVWTGNASLETTKAALMQAVKPRKTRVSGIHPWLHPTKGWRDFARPRGTNKRRKLIRQGELMVFHR